IRSRSRTATCSGRRVGGRARRLPCPLAPDPKSAGTRRVAAPSRPAPKISVGRGEASFFPRGGEQPGFEPPLLLWREQKGEAERVRMACFSRRLILPERYGVSQG